MVGKYRGKVVRISGEFWVDEVDKQYINPRRYIIFTILMGILY